MSPVVAAIVAAGLVGLGLYGAIAHRSLLRRIVALNILAAGVFLLFGAIARRGGGDPVPQAMVITGIVVAFAGTALAVALLLRLNELGVAAPDDGDAEEES